MKPPRDFSGEDDGFAEIADLLAGETSMTESERQRILKAAGLDEATYGRLEAAWSKAREVSSWEAGVRREALGTEPVEAGAGAKLMMETVLAEAGRAAGEKNPRLGVSGDEKRVGHRPILRLALIAAAAIALVVLGAKWGGRPSSSDDDFVDPGLTLGQEAAVLVTPAPGSVVTAVEALIWEVAKNDEDDLRLFVEVQDDEGSWQSALDNGRAYVGVRGTVWTPSDTERARLDGEVRVSLQVAPPGAEPLMRKSWSFSVAP
ncbi:MAG: hypothetical protein AAGG01_21715 [Planctomycetota bacterium]